MNFINELGFEFVLSDSGWEESSRNEKELLSSGADCISCLVNHKTQKVIKIMLTGALKNNTIYDYFRVLRSDFSHKHINLLAFEKIKIRGASLPLQICRVVIPVSKNVNEVSYYFQLNRFGDVGYASIEVYNGSDDEKYLVELIKNFRYSVGAEVYGGI